MRCERAGSGPLPYLQIIQEGLRGLAKGAGTSPRDNKSFRDLAHNQMCQMEKLLGCLPNLQIIQEGLRGSGEGAGMNASYKPGNHSGRFEGSREGAGINASSKPANHSGILSTFRSVKSERVLGCLSDLQIIQEGLRGLGKGAGTGPGFTPALSFNVSNSPERITLIHLVKHRRRGAPT